jgi:hypothetical protein
VLSRDLKYTFSFNVDSQGWVKEGKLWYDKDNLEWSKEGYKNPGSLVIRQGGSSSPIIRWQSPPLDVTGWNGISVKGLIKGIGEITPDNKEGFFRIDFFRSEEDAKEGSKRILTRLSSRIDNPNVWMEKDVITKLPDGTNYIRIGFQAYDTVSRSISLDQLEVYKADVKEDLKGYTIEHFVLDQNILFPNSHGGL